MSGSIKYKLNKWRSINSRLPYDMPASYTPPTWVLSPIVKLNRQGRYNKSLRATEIAMMRAWVASSPLIPARMLMLFVQKVDKRDMYT